MRFRQTKLHAADSVIFALLTLKERVSGDSVQTVYFPCASPLSVSRHHWTFDRWAVCDYNYSTVYTVYTGAECVKLSISPQPLFLHPEMNPVWLRGDWWRCCTVAREEVISLLAGFRTRWAPRLFILAHRHSRRAKPDQAQCVRENFIHESDPQLCSAPLAHSKLQQNSDLP